MIIAETEAPGPLSYTLAPTDINYSVDRCRGRLFRDDDYDIRWTPPVGRESQCAGRVAEDSLCSRCLHNLARWRESCGTAEVRGGDQDWWGRVDDPMPARAPTLAGKGWVAEKNPGWTCRPSHESCWNTDTVESLTATLAALTAEYAQIHFDYESLVEEEDYWPKESDDLDEQLRAEQAALRRLTKVVKKGGILPPAAPVAPAPVPAAETVGSLRVKVAEMRKKRDDWKRIVDGLMAEGWLISKRVRKAFADVREKTAVARELLALRAENAALKAAAAAVAVVPADMVAENGALRARIAALEVELADADSLNKTLAEQLACEIQRANEVGDSARSAFEERMAPVREEAARAIREAADFKAQFEEADFHRRAFEKAHEEAGAAYRSHVAELTRQIGNLEENYDFSKEFNGRLRAELEEAFAAKRQFSEDLGAALKRATDAEEAVELVSTSNASLERRCEELGETIDGLRRGLEEASQAKLRFSDDFAAALERAAAAEKMLKELREALDQSADQHGEMTREIERLRATAAVADYEAVEAHEEVADLGRALAYGGDREEELESERYRWQERYKDLRRLIAETLTEVEPILEREETMPAGVALRALSLLK